MKYIQHRSLIPSDNRKVWAFMGDGEMDEPESMGAIGMAGRERLDNLIFVINCSLQRLDGPVRGNGKIIQELESDFRGAGWNVIKVIWGSYWDPAAGEDKKGILRKRMMECVDGDYQTFKARVTARMCASISSTRRAAQAGLHLDRRRHLAPQPRRPRSHTGTPPTQAVAHRGQPTVILAKTIKGYGMGEAGEARTSPTSRRRWEPPRCAPSATASKLPVRTRTWKSFPISTFPEGSGSTTCASGAWRWAATCRRGAARWSHAAGAAADRLRRLAESRWRGTRVLHHDGLRARPQRLLKGQGDRQADGAHRGGRVAHLRHGGPVPPDRHLEPGRPEVRAAGRRPDDVLPKGTTTGQILQEGINEAGAMADWIAAGTAIPRMACR